VRCLLDENLSPKLRQCLTVECGFQANSLLETFSHSSIRPVPLRIGLDNSRLDRVAKCPNLSRPIVSPKISDCIAIFRNGFDIVSPFSKGCHRQQGDSFNQASPNGFLESCLRIFAQPCFEVAVEQSFQLPNVFSIKVDQVVPIR
jgi:hypothetical protein